MQWLCDHIGPHIWGGGGTQIFILLNFSTLRADYHCQFQGLGYWQIRIKIEVFVEVVHFLKTLAERRVMYSERFEEMNNFGGPM